MIRSLCALTLAAVLLGGCATAPSTSDLATAPVSNKAVVQSLFNDGRTALATGRGDEAVRAFEHALRIEPRNAMLWHYLSQTRLQQGQYDQAESLAAKSNTLAGDDHTLRSANWQVIAQARAGKGDNAGADAARARAEAATR